MKDLEKAAKLLGLDLDAELTPDAIQQAFEKRLDGASASADPSAFRAALETARENLLTHIRSLGPGDDATRTDLGAAAGAGNPLAQLALERGDLFAGRFRIVEKVGAGQMGRVYKVRDEHDGDEIRAIKVLVPDLSGERERMLREERKLAHRLKHGGIVTVIEIHKDEERRALCISMEFLEGRPLTHRIQEARDTGRISYREFESIAKQACDALQASHDEGIVHCDIKPSNMVIDAGGRLKIVDFGIASLRVDLQSDGTIRGTPRYMAPEQREVPPKRVARTDQYALALVLYELLGGNPTFEGSPTPPHELESSTCKVSKKVSKAIVKALSQAVDGRFASMTKFREAMFGAATVEQRPYALVATVAALLVTAVVIVVINSSSADAKTLPTNHNEAVEFALDEVTSEVIGSAAVGADSKTLVAFCGSPQELKQLRRLHGGLSRLEAGPSGAALHWEGREYASSESLRAELTRMWTVIRQARADVAITRTITERSIETIALGGGAVLRDSDLPPDAAFRLQALLAARLFGDCTAKEMQAGVAELARTHGLAAIVWPRIEELSHQYRIVVSSYAVDSASDPREQDALLDTKFTPAIAEALGVEKAPKPADELGHRQAQEERRAATLLREEVEALHRDLVLAAEEAQRGEQPDVVVWVTVAALANSIKNKADSRFGSRAFGRADSLFDSRSWGEAFDAYGQVGKELQTVKSRLTEVQRVGRIWSEVERQFAVFGAMFEKKRGDYDDLFHHVAAKAGWATRIDDVRGVLGSIKVATEQSQFGQIEARSAAAKKQLDDLGIEVTRRLEAARQMATADDEGHLPIHIACRAGDLERVRECLEVYAEALDAPDETGRPPLFLALEGRHESIAEFLLESGAKIAVRRIKRRTESLLYSPLHIVARHGASEQMVGRLLGAGILVDVLGPLEATPLYLAAEFGHVAVIEALLSHKPPPSLDAPPGMKTMKTPLMAAAAQGHIEAYAALWPHYRGELPLLERRDNLGRDVLAFVGQRGTQKMLDDLNAALDRLRR